MLASSVATAMAAGVRAASIGRSRWVPLADHSAPTHSRAVPVSRQTTITRGVQTRAGASSSRAPVFSTHTALVQVKLAASSRRTQSPTARVPRLPPTSGVQCLVATA